MVDQEKESPEERPRKYYGENGWLADALRRQTVEMQTRRKMEKTTTSTRARRHGPVYAEKR